jgi:hypothetical protein
LIITQHTETWKKYLAAAFGLIGLVMDLTIHYYVSGLPASPVYDPASRIMRFLVNFDLPMPLMILHAAAHAMFIGGFMFITIHPFHLKKKTIAAIVIIILVVLSSLAVVALNEEGKLACRQKYPNGLPLYGQPPMYATSVGQLTFVMNEQSSILVCVNYVATYVKSPLSLSILATVGTGFEKLPNGTFTVTGSVNSVSVSENASSIILTPGSKVTVAFMIKALSSKGYFFVSFPLICPPLALSVGNNVSQLNATNFPGMSFNSCPPFDVNPEIVDVEGGSTTYVILTS